MNLFYYSIIMWNKFDSFSQFHRNKQTQMSFQNQNEANVQILQQFDNPKRHILSSNFLAYHSCSPNDLQLISNKQIKTIQSISTRRFSLIKIDSLVMDKDFEPSIQVDDSIKQSTFNMKKQKQKRVTISHQSQIEDLKKLSIFRQTKNFIVSDKRIYEPIQVKLQKFVNIKYQQPQKYYKFQGKIGQGSFGLVHKALCLRTKQLRAIKILKHHKKQKQNKLSEKNLQQLKVLKILDHPNIIKLYQVFYFNDFFYLVTQYCEGGSILNYLKQNRFYSEKIVKTIIKQLLSALSYLHLLKIAHRDIKLENILFIKKINCQSNSQDVQIKIIDFGQSLIMKFSHNNRDSRQIGTITYMAPQVLTGLYSQKCDIWSCGVIFWILLSGRNPFRKGSKIQTLNQIKTKQVQFRGNFWNDVPLNIKQLLKRMLQKDPLRRISARQALKNNWFSQKNTNINPQKMKQIVKKLYHYYRGNNLISVVQSYLTFVKITQQQKTQITKQFKKIDKDNSGSIDINQLRQAFIMCTGNEHDDQMDYILKKIDKNKSRKIDLNQFITALYGRKKLFHQNSLQLAFGYFDTDQDGYIDKKQLKSVLQGCDQQQINRILQDIDLNGDEKISKEQFARYIKEQRFL